MCPGSVREDLSGRIFGRLTVISEAGRTKHGSVRWLCRCSCGVERVCSAGDLKSGHTTSCGCLKREQLSERRRTHGDANNKTGVAPEYNVWNNMIGRCYRETDRSYKNYGARGITVCVRWRSSYENFLEDMGRRPSDEHSIERKNNNGNYAPANCFWATDAEQRVNRRNNKRITYGGETLTLTEWALRTGIKRTTIDERIKRGWSVERALTA